MHAISLCLFFIDVKIDPKSGSEGVIESEQSFVIPKKKKNLCSPAVIPWKWRLLYALSFQSAYECCLLLFSTSTQACYFLEVLHVHYARVYVSG